MSHLPLLCEAEQSQLLVIDIQQRLASAMPDKVLQAVTLHTGWLLQAASLLEVPVVRTEQYPRGLGNTLEEISQHIEKDTRLEKTSFSCCGAEGFNDNLTKTNRRQIVITGMESHVCVLQTAMQLKAMDYDVFVVSDATCSRDKRNHKNALQRMAQAGVIISNTESVMFEWLRDASHPQFKAVSQLLR
ncbi:MAG: hydrolase [Gammaproteobacteria bacterium]|nr:hydrolase [Gammaproteobacteria bacterium]